jgi:hypothetical protein
VLADNASCAGDEETEELKRRQAEVARMLALRGREDEGRERRLLSLERSLVSRCMHYAWNNCLRSRVVLGSGVVHNAAKLRIIAHNRDSSATVFLNWSNMQYKTDKNCGGVELSRYRPSFAWLRGKMGVSRDLPRICTRAKQRSERAHREGLRRK